MSKDRTLRLHISRKLDRETGAAKQLVFPASRIHRILQIAGGQKRNRSRLAQIAIRAEHFRIGCDKSIQFRRTSDTNDAQAAIFFGCNSLARLQEPAKWPQSIKRANMSDRKFRNIPRDIERGQPRHMKINEKERNAVFLAIKVAHAPAGDIHAPGAPQEVGKSASQ